MAYDERLAQRIRQALQARSDVSEKKMFGGLAFMTDGRMFVGVLGTTLMVRVGKDAEAAARARAHVRAMDFTGRPLAGYVYVDAPGCKTAVQLRHWLNQALEFVLTLPPRR